MYKKLIMACMGIAAFVVVPTASASPVLTENGSFVAVGAEITGNNVGVAKFTGSVTVECSNADFVGKVTKNSGTKIAGEIPAGSTSFTGTGTGSDCTSNLFNSPAKVTVNSSLCMETVTGSDTIHVTGCFGSVVFTLSLTGNGPCVYSTASISATFLTNFTPTVVEIFGQPVAKREGGVFCPSSGSLDMTFYLWTKGGTVPLTIS